MQFAMKRYGVLHFANSPSPIFPRKSTKNAVAHFLPDETAQTVSWACQKSQVFLDFATFNGNG
jgi:hypothetical protein